MNQHRWKGQYPGTCERCKLRRAVVRGPRAGNIIVYTSLGKLVSKAGPLPPCEPPPVKLSSMWPGRRLLATGYPELGVGVVEKVLATRVRIRFQREVRTYDGPHLQFLESA